MRARKIQTSKGKTGRNNLKSRPRRRKQAAPLPSPSPSIKSKKDLLIAGVGASAGGFTAFTQLLKSLPPKTGIAFVLVQHLDPHHESQLATLLSRSTNLPVTEIKDQTVPEPDHVYVLPPNQHVNISKSVLHLVPRNQTEGQHLPVDFFFKSLALDQGHRAIGIILSGNGSDGTAGLKEIKAAGGVTFSQELKSAEFRGMPSSAISAGGVDFILPPGKIAQELHRVALHPAVGCAKAEKPVAIPGEEPAGLNKIFSLLRALTGVDFSHYKHSTLKRRIIRRMVLKQMAHLRDYVKYLEQNPPEIDSLFQELLINVTSFFRDPEIFQALSKTIFPRI